jgi:hypothetical protein
MKINRLIGLFVFIVVVIVLIDFSITQQKKVSYKKNEIESNKYRDELNIPPLKKNWIIEFIEDSVETWGDGELIMNSIEPHHYYKELIYNSKNRLELERDVFHYEYSTNIAYRLSCTFNYNDNSVSFRFIVYNRGSFPPTDGFTVTKDFADSIFMAWDLPVFY